MNDFCVSEPGCEYKRVVAMHRDTVGKKYFIIGGV
jgi:hypothetical protein